MDHNNQYTTINTNLSEKAFDAILNNIKIENNSLFNDESNDLEDSASIAYMSIDNKDKKQDEICELASTSYEKDVNVTESNSQEPSDTELVDGEFVSIHTSSLSTALPITQISSKSTPHICLKHCFSCNHGFRVLDSPFHISQLRNIDKQNEFLKIDPSLCIDSCLCDFCWKFLEKTYVSNNPKRVIEESFSEKRTKRVERFVNKKGLKYKKRRPWICSIHFCSKPYYHKMSVNEYENIEKILSTVECSCLDCVQSTKQTSDFLTFPFYLCKDHNDLITLMSSCQICSCKLNEPFNTADWSVYKTWNRVLIENNLPLTLQHGMFICMSCRKHISKPNPGFPTINLPLFREYITMSNAIRLKLYGESQDILFNICQGSTFVTSPIVVPKIKEEKECVSKKVKFSHPLITRTFHYEVDFDENDIKSITSTALLNVAEQNLVTPKLEPQNEGEHFKTFTTNKPTGQLCNFYTDSTPNKSDIEMTNSLNENVDYTPENILSEQNSLSNLTDNVSNNFTVNLNETDNSGYSCVVAVEPSNAILNPVLIKRKPNNVICDTISNKNVKKPRVNEKYSFMDNNTNKPYRDKNIVHPNKNKKNNLNVIPSNCKNKYVLNSDFIGVQNPSSNVDEKLLKLHSKCSPKNIKLSTNVPSVKKYSRKRLKNVLFDDISDSESIPETITLSEHGSDSEIIISDTIILSDSEEFSETDSEEILPDIKENDFIVVDSDYNFDSDSECEKILKYTPQLNSLDGSNSEIVPECIMRFGAERESAHEESQLTVTNTEKVFNDKKSTSFKVVNKKLDHEVLLNYVKLFETYFINENKNKYFCAYDDEIELSGHQGSLCIIIYDNIEKSSNKNITTYKVNVEKGLCYKILLDEEKVEIVHDSENINKPSKILFSKEIESSGNKEASICIVILDNEKENCNKKLSTFKTVFNIRKPISEILANGNEVCGVRFYERIDYIMSYIEIESSSDDKQSGCLITHCGEDIIKKCVKKNVGNDSDNQEIDNKKVSDIIIMPNDMINVDDDSHGVKELDKVQEYFKDIFSEIQRYFETTANQSHRELYSKIGNGTGMLLYLMENLRMLYNEELVISKTANEFSKNYLNEQKKILYNCFGDPNDSVNASKPFIHPSSHLHQYSKRLSADNHLQSEMTTSSSLTKSKSIASKVQIQVSKGTSAYLRYMVLPYALKKKP